MELEELAARVKAGEPGAALKLWEAVRRFVEMKARRWVNNAMFCRVEVCDLTQAGFLAVLETAERFEPGQGYGFLHALGYALKKAFAEATGTRSTKRDAVQYAESIDATANPNDPDGLTLSELIPDEGAALAFVGVEYADFLSYCRGMIGAALDSLTPAQARIIRLRYLRGMTLEAVAQICGLSSRQAASEAEERGLYDMWRGKYRRELRDCLTAFEDFRQYGEAARSDTWSRTGLSRTEAEALVNTGRDST